MAYWSFRLMIGFGILAILVALLGLWATRKGRLPAPRWWWRLGPFAVLLPLLANSFGWIFTEMGRQPWVVFGVMRTSKGVSPSVGAATVATSLIVFTVLYAVLAVIEVGLIVRYAKAGPAAAPAAGDDQPPTPGSDGDRDGKLAFAY